MKYRRPNCCYPPGTVHWLRWHRKLIRKLRKAGDTFQEIGQALGMTACEAASLLGVDPDENPTPEQRAEYAARRRAIFESWSPEVRANRAVGQAAEPLEYRPVVVQIGRGEVLR